MAKTIIRIKVKANARNASFVQLSDGSWLAEVISPAIEGKANRELIGLVAKHFRCHKAAVSIQSGASSRTKLVRIN